MSDLEKKYDLLIAGAGVFGITLAMEASQRGLTVLLVDNRDFGSGTSSNSLKTIHGGLRYLQSLDIKSSIISARERKAWLTMAPSLVRPLACVLPTSSELMKSKLLVGAGMLFYNLLTFKRNSGMPEQEKIPNSHLISKLTLGSIIPKLSDDHVTGGGCWYDAQAINTERLMMACLNNAQNYGATVVNYHSIESVVRRNNLIYARLNGANTTPTGKPLRGEVTARYFVDCTGRDTFLECGHLKEKLIEPSSYVKGVNFVVKKHISTHAFGVKSNESDGASRMFFIAPWSNQYTSSDYILVGTWYFDSTSSDPSSMTELEIHTCIEQVNSAFSEPLFTIDDIVQVHIGHLPADNQLVESVGPDSALIKHAELKDWSKFGSEYEGMFSLKGTKFTLARKAAEDTVSYLKVDKGVDVSPSISAASALSDITVESINRLKQLEWNDIQISFVEQYFPLGIDKIITLCEDNSRLINPVPGADYCCQAIVVFCIKFEYVAHLTDLLIRRLPIGNYEMPEKEVIEFCVDLLGTHLGWDEKKKVEEVASLKNYYMKS